MGLSNRYFADDNFEEQKRINWKKIYSNLSRYGIQSIKYIENALQIKNDC